MSERKVLIKYYPPDFDHSKLKKVTRARDKQDNVRMMLPMSVRCDTCGNFLYIGTKFNMRKETVLDEDYLGIKIFRFYFKCSRCHAEIAMKTDPKQHDYVCESGASRNYESWRDLEHVERVLKAKSQLEDDQDAMKRVEKKGFNSKREMDILDALNEVRQLNKRQAELNHDQLLFKTLAKLDSVENEEMESRLKKFQEKQKFKRIEDNISDADDVIDISDPFALLVETEADSESDQEESSEDSDIDIVKKTQQHKINPLSFLLLGKRQKETTTEMLAPSKRQKTDA